MVRVARWLPIFALIILSLAFFYKLAFSDMILARGDTYHYFYPYWDARNDAMRAGELPLWTPNIFMGAPLLANPQLGTFYPPNWLTIPFAAPDAIRISILMHVAWAAIGMFVLFRQAIERSTMPALLAASVFALGGYLGAHVEQINQLQGLAWIPWLFYLYHRSINDNRRFLWLILLAMAWALQIFSGHTQTVFVSGVGLGMYAIVHEFSIFRAQHVTPLHKYIKAIAVAILLLIVAAIFAVLLATPQMIPTLELTGMSNRGGGFNPNQVTAFSLPPNYIGRALLPSYDGQLFGEYIGYVGVIALGLAIYGAITPTENGRSRWIWISLSMVGLIFALGEFNGFYVYLAELPGFNLFRVPARWLALYSLGISVLAGYGLIALQSRRIEWPCVVIAIVPLVVLMAMGRLLPILQEDIVGSATPTMVTMIGWGIGLFIFVIVVWVKFTWARHALPLQITILVCVVVELFLASRVMPYNDLAPRDVYLGQRFTISQMLAYTEDQTPPGRVLSISGRFFDPGDIGTLRERYNRMGMDEEAQHTAFTAVKNQEILFPNLGLTWDIPTIDGYGGGVLPTIYYSQFTSLLLPEGMPRTVDGRLVENLAQPECRGACIPYRRFLWMTDTRYIITDKVYDVWYDGVAFDTTFPVQIEANVHYFVNFYNQPDFEGNLIEVLYSGEKAPLVGYIEDYVAIAGADNIEQEIVDDNLSIVRFHFNETIKPVSVNLAHPDFELDNQYSPLDSPSLTILAATLVDTRTGDFQQLELANTKRILSSDIKIYEVIPFPPSSFRARIADDTRFIAYLPDDWQGHEEAIALLREDETRSIIHGDATALSEIEEAGVPPSEIDFSHYSTNRVEMKINTYQEAYLFLFDAYYPGWRATVNGEETEIYRANVMFRAVRVPAGESTVVFEFVPMLWYYAIAFGGIVWVLGIGIIGVVIFRARHVTPLQ